MTGRCKTEYIVTGATGFLGGAVVRELISRGRSVTALALPEDPLLPLLPEGAFVRFGDVTDRASLIPAFEGAEGCRVIHCAGMVSVAAGQGEALGRINVQGTENIAGLCLEYGAKRLVYVSSVHAIPERPMGEVITEECRVSPELVHGAYAKSKAAANKKVLLAAEKGLDAGIVYPSGIIGPGDRGMGSMTVMLRSFLRGRAARRGLRRVRLRRCAGRGRRRGILREQRAARRGLYTLRALCLHKGAFDLGGKALRQESAGAVPSAPACGASRANIRAAQHTKGRKALLHPLFHIRPGLKREFFP